MVRTFVAAVALARRDPRRPAVSGSQKGAVRAVPLVAVLLMIVAGAGLLLRLAWRNG